MEIFTEMEIKILQKQREVLKDILTDPSFFNLEAPLQEAIKRSLAASAEVLI